MRLVVAAVAFALVAYLAYQAMELQKAEDAHHDAAEEYFRQLEEQK